MKTTAFLVAATAAALAGAEAQDRIVGGIQVASPTSYPWIVSLSTRGANGSSFCGGSLVAPNVVITAAHCVFTNAASITARVKGSTSTLATGAEAIQVAQAIRHPAYNSATQDNDIAILILATPSTVTPLKIDQGQLAINAYDGQNVKAIGWGRLAQNGQAATNLQEVDVPVVSQAACNGPTAYPDSITDNMICAGLAAGGKDSCQGDSGGPLIKTIDGVQRLVAAVSWGQGCALAGKFGVYARVKTTLPFLRQYVPADAVAGEATAAPVAGPVGPAPPAPPAAVDQVCRCSGCRGKYDICGTWDLKQGATPNTVCLLEDPSTDPLILPNCASTGNGQIRYSNNFKQFYMTGCIVAGLGAQAQGITSQGLVGMTLSDDESLYGGGGDEKLDFASDVLPYVGAAVGVTGIAAGVVLVARKQNRNAYNTGAHPSNNRSNQMGYFDKGTKPNGRTMQL